MPPLHHNSHQDEPLERLIEQLQNLPRNSDTLSERIELCHQGLMQVRREEQPELWARFHCEIGLCLSQRFLDDPRDGDSREQAIAHYKNALKEFTPATFFNEWVDTTYNLALLYERRDDKNQQDNIEQAIELYKEIARRSSRHVSPSDWARSHTSLGRLYFQRIRGDRSNNIETAIEHCCQALEIWSRDEHTIQWAETRDLLGILYRFCLGGDPAQNMEKALCHHQAALDALTPIRSTCPQDWARVQRNLSVALLYRIHGDRTDNLERAITYLEQALNARGAAAQPTERAEAAHNLAIAYIERQQGDGAENVEHAIALLNTALRVYRRETFPAMRALSQSILGNAYLRRTRGERAGNTERAIECYVSALQEQDWGIYTQEKAITQHNLAVAYSERLLKDPLKNLERAVEYAQAALETTDPRAKLKWALIKTDLIDILWKLANLKRRRGVTQQATATMNKAIAHGQEVIAAFADRPPCHHWALAHYNLGNVYGDYAGDLLENQEQAIEHYHRALDFFTEQNYPVRWADTHNNLGVSYLERIRGKRSDNVNQARQHFELALSLGESQARPVNVRRSARNLANLYFWKKDWPSALGIYQKAMDAGEQLYHGGLSAEGKMAEAGENAALYHRAAFATAQRGPAHTAQALLTLERGKTRLLTEALRWRVPRPTGVPDPVWADFEAAGAALRAVQYGQIAREHDPSAGAYTAREQAAHQAIAALDAAVKQVREFAADFLQDLALDSVVGLLPDEHTALLAFCITELGSIGFVVSHAEAVQRVDVPGFSTQDLRGLVQQWIDAYQSSDDVRWRSVIEPVLARVGTELLAPILAALPPCITKLVLLPSGGLYLLPLHAAPLDGPGVCLLDRYQVWYAPSATVLERCQERAAHARRQGLFAIANPTSDLAYAESEVPIIASLFEKPRTILKRQKATKERVLAQASGHGYAHFSCHGQYDWDDPSRSALLLSGSLETDQNGHRGVDYERALTLAEVQKKLDLSQTCLVTFSACETGLSQATGPRAEEYVGLPAGFLMAGAPTVVASLWTVFEISTALLMERFYKNHLCGDPEQDPTSRSPLPAAEALRRAQTWLRDKVTAQAVARRCDEQIEKLEDAGQDPPEWLSLAWREYAALARKTPDHRPFTPPFYWAAFALYGADCRPGDLCPTTTPSASDRDDLADTMICQGGIDHA